MRRKHKRQCPRDEHRWDALANYNAERNRGIVHTPEWKAKMAEEQARFDAEMLAKRIEIIG